MPYRSAVLIIAFLLAAATAAALTDDECLSCHESVKAKAFASSIHTAVGCSGCHADVTAAPHETKPARVDCATCHADATTAWNASMHAKGVTSGMRSAQCADCHGPVHEILPSSDPASRTFHKTIPATCGRCHAQKFIVEQAALSTAPSLSYQDSVHGRAAARGSVKAAVCTDCHDSHAVLPGNDPQSGVFKFNVSRTCGKCHAAIAVKYNAGVHGKALARGNWSSPVCTDCHGIHAIAKTSDTVRGPRATCVHCHDGVKLTQEYSVPVARVETFTASYHGLAQKMGSKTAADCASCHGAHDILPSTNRWSMVNRNNLPQTCGKCHPGAAAQFANGNVHIVGSVMAGDVPSRVITAIKWIYIVAILATIGFMLSHNFVVWSFKARAQKRASNRTVVRMNANQRAQHAILVVSFTVLVLSGFALVWPESWLGIAFINEGVRRWIHRVAAVVMMVLGAYHIGYMTITTEGRRGLRDFWLKFSDFGDIVRIFRYYLGLSTEKPAFGRFTYAEKIEYWAGMWGTIVMSVTGIVIWFAVTVTNWIPRWWVDIATTIHLFEAILATLSIAVWHFYHVIFDPDVYPMNWAWYDGRMSEEQYREEHGLDEESRS
jgi:cytochrome b subunit of formate dehydrogenase